MMRIDKLAARLKACSGTFPWRDFVNLLAGLGYEPMNAGKTGGSRRKFRHPETGRMIFLDEPHDGEMKPSMVRRLRDDLEQRGEL
jgi:predicted RNA binding protein YcfA (HicA-like mRNA interferase family)